jgi:hypothetical protein
MAFHMFFNSAHLQQDLVGGIAFMPRLIDAHQYVI